MCCSKFILFTTNIVLFIVGVFVIGIASVVINRGNDYGALLMDGVLTLPILILILGLFIAILGFLGCFGALRESKCMLYTYSTIVLVFFIAEIVLAIFILTHPGATKDAMGEYMTTKFKGYGGADQSLTNSIDRMQQDMECCGVYGSSDWTKWAKRVPDSCCSGRNCNGITGTIIDNIGSNSFYEQGCLDALIDDLKSVSLALGISAIVLGVLMFFSMATACGLAKKNNYR